MYIGPVRKTIFVWPFKSLLKRGGMIPIDRKNRKLAIESLNKAASILK